MKLRVSLGLSEPATVPCHCHKPNTAGDIVSDIVYRKAEHPDILSSGLGRQSTATTASDASHLEQGALPERDRDALDMSSTFPGRPVAVPRLVSSIAGGAAQAERINRQIAEACGGLRFGCFVKSPCDALKGPNACGSNRRRRDAAGADPTIANLAAVRQDPDEGPDHATRAICVIGADALVPHLNFLQDAHHAGGDTRLAGLLRRIEALARDLTVPWRACLPAPVPGSDP